MEEENKRNNLTIQDFMNDMRILDEQLKDRELVKPNFDFGSNVVTNYINWLLLGEIMRLNDNLEDEE